MYFCKSNLAYFIPFISRKSIVVRLEKHIMCPERYLISKIILISAKNRMGPSIVPCGTPISTMGVELKCCPIVTL